MTLITKSALAAVILATMAVSANAQQGPTRQIQVLAAPGQAGPAVVAQAPAPVQVDAAPKFEAPVEAAPAPEPAPQVVEAPAPKVIKVVKSEPKFVHPVIEKPVHKVFEKPVHKASYGHGYGHAKRAHCH